MKLFDFKGFSYLIPILILCLISGIIVVFFKLFTVKDLWYETYAAIIGVVITAVITFILLKGQTEKEEEREKSLEIHKHKIAVYASFIQGLWSKLDDGYLTSKDMLEIRRKCFNELIFYLDEKQIKEITEQFKKISDEIQHGANEADLTEIVSGPFEEITKVLIKDIDSRRVNVGKSIYRQLFNSFSIDSITESTIKGENTSSAKNTSTTSTNAPSISQTIQPISDQNYNENKNEIDYSFYRFKRDDLLNGGIKCWHFNAFDWETQKLHLDKLAFIEYGEDWRTNKAKMVKEGDLIFLYARGGGGYRGVFRAKNIAYDGKNDSPTLVFDSTKETDEDYTNKNAESFDIYHRYEDGATLCTAINVEQIIFYEEGVGCPIGIRRRTIDPFNNIEDITTLLYTFDKKRREEKIKIQAI